LHNSAASSGSSGAPAASSGSSGAEVSLPYRQLGSGNVKTPDFTVLDNTWGITWSYDCSKSGNFGNFIVSVNGYGSAKGTQAQGINELGASGNGIDPVNDKGTFNLSIQSECNWTVAISQH